MLIHQLYEQNGFIFLKRLSVKIPNWKFCALKAEAYFIGKIGIINIQPF